jgi:hypothetical protein
MLQITQEHLNKFQQIVDRFRSKTKIPKENNWYSWSDNDIWLHTMAQVMVVGKSAPLDKFYKSDKLRKEVAYERLRKMTDEKNLNRTINRVLLAVGTRYASSNISKCLKTKALVHNLKTLKNYGGPRKFVKRVSEFQGPNADKQRIEFVVQTFMFIKNKGARDYLMELGLLRNAVALDVRVQNVLRKIGIEVPKGFESNPQLYDSIQNDILEKICKPLGISGIEFDRMLYQNYDDIIRMNM